jgi:hypothetical protein
VVSFVVVADDPSAVLRLAGTTCENKLLVFIWILGGGLYAGSTVDPEYNLSGIASVGQKFGKPIFVGSTHPPVSHL